MRSFLPFFVIVLGFYVLASIYVYRLGRWFFESRISRRIYAIVFLTVTSSYILSRIFAKFMPVSPITDFFVYTGSFWFSFMLYLLIAGFSSNIVAFVVRVKMRLNRRDAILIRIHRFGAYIAVAASVIIVTYGAINARIRIMNPVSIESNLVKSEIKIALVTDIHLGRIIGRAEANEMSARIKALNPDIIIIGGDLFDEDLNTVMKQNHGDYLSLLKARYGVYAVTGNHEYIGGVESAVAYMRKHGITVLRDEFADAGPFILVGREDIRGSRALGIKRKSIKEILESKKTKPVIVIDHQPVAVRESVESMAFLHLSGHTHGGQLWPIGYVTSMIYEVPLGYRYIEKTNIYVSSGFGTWGPPVRVGNRPEIVIITVKPSGR